MRRIAIGSGLLALVFALIGGTVPAAAEFFGCNDGHSSRSVSYRSYHRAPSYRSASQHRREFATQSRPRVHHSHVTYYRSSRYADERSRW